LALVLSSLLPCLAMMFKLRLMANLFKVKSNDNHLKTKAMKSIEQRLQDLEDEAAIHSLVARFADACIVADYEEFKTLWATNGKWTIHEPFLASSEGIQKIDEMLRGLRKGREFFVQFVHSGVIKLKGDKATARWVMHEVSKGPGDVYYNNYAIYIDSLQKSEGKWQFVKRDYHYMWLDTGAFPGAVFALPTYLG
jgi:hypothetical protein